jgi:hypothetical protein
MGLPKSHKKKWKKERNFFFIKKLYICISLFHLYYIPQIVIQNV